eukprot:TRINITY_DN14252_c0_g1_i2.p2 TRINITY_DN14252_c0_g1~~TRINITY_DN14252_c0_g1_i2.p2  ORF type:complete len:158 (+),score=20.11 TRINITY_DN14252_c0_g1_i2:610-1083(+)
MGRLLDSTNTSSRTHPQNWKQSFRSSQQFQVNVTLLDDLVQEVPFVLKIDVEGNELKVLQGAPKLLAARPPVIIIEFNPAMMEWSQGDSAVEVLLLLHNHGTQRHGAVFISPIPNRIPPFRLLRVRAPAQGLHAKIWPPETSGIHGARPVAAEEQRV